MEQLTAFSEVDVNEASALSTMMLASILPVVSVTTFPGNLPD